MRPLSKPISSQPPRRARGVAAVEFALVLGLMITILAGIVEFGRVFWYYDALSKSTRNAARLVAVSAKATVATVAAPNAKAMVVAAATDAGIPAFTSANVDVECLDSDLLVTPCSDGTAPTGVRVSVTSYTIFLGSYVPFLVGGVSSYTVALAPSTTMPYMPL
jgi:Flp pilus assembly protein TadG